MKRPNPEPLTAGATATLKDASQAIRQPLRYEAPPVGEDKANRAKPQGHGAQVSTVQPFKNLRTQ